MQADVLSRNNHVNQTQLTSQGNPHPSAIPCRYSTRVGCCFSCHGELKLTASRLVGIMLQISIIILFKFLLKCYYAQFYSLYTYDFIIIYHLQVIAKHLATINTAYKHFPHTPQHCYQYLRHLLLPNH